MVFHEPYTREERNLSREIRSLQSERYYYSMKVKDKTREIKELKKLLHDSLRARGIEPPKE